MHTRCAARHHPDRRGLGGAVWPVDPDQRRGHVILEVPLADPAVRIHLVDERVASGRHAGDVDVLALELRPVVVAISGRQSLEHLECLRVAARALSGPLAVEGPRVTPRLAGLIAIAEAEARLLIGAHLPAGARVSQRVAVEAENVKVIVGLGVRVAHGDHACESPSPPIGQVHDLLRLHRFARVRAPPSDDQGSLPYVANRRLEPQPELRARRAVHLQHRHLGRHILRQVGQQPDRSLALRRPGAGRQGRTEQCEARDQEQEQRGTTWRHGTVCGSRG